MASGAVFDLSDATQVDSSVPVDRDPPGARSLNPFDVMSLAEESPTGDATSVSVGVAEQPRAGSGYQAGSGGRPVFGPNPEVPGVAVASLALDSAERDWWRHQHLRLRRRANLALALAGIALVAWVLLLYTKPGLGPLGGSAPWLETDTGLGAGPGAGPEGRPGVVSGAALNSAPRPVAATPPSPPDSPFDPRYPDPRQELAAPTPGTEAAVGKPRDPPPSLRQSELEMQVLRLESRLAVLEEQQLAIDRALAQVRGAVLEASPAGLSSPAAPAE